MPAQTEERGNMMQVAGWLRKLEWAQAELVFSDPVQERLPDTDQPATHSDPPGALIAVQSRIGADGVGLLHPGR